MGERGRPRRGSGSWVKGRVRAEPAARFQCARGWAAWAPQPGGAADNSSRVGPGRVL